MIESTELTTFFAITLLYAFMPGPAMLYSVAQTLSGGRRSGFTAVLGLHVGGYVHILLVVLGVSAIFVSNPFLFKVVQTLGALYLIWLGFERIYLSYAISSNANQIETVVSRSRTFVDSMVVDILNPKAALFYLAFLPQFTNPDSSIAVWLQMLLLGIATNIMFSSADFLSVIVSDRLQKTVSEKKWWLDFAFRWAGSIFIILGLATLIR
ncbi:LysE family translocator [Vibrio sp. VNB-15]